MNYVKIEPSIIEKSPDAVLSIGDEVVIRPFASILCKKSITIGTRTQIAGGVTIVDHDHFLGDPISDIHRVGDMEPIDIGAYCWIGANAVILKGVKLGYGCIVGAGAIVTSGEYLPGSIIVGNPGKVIKRRSI